MNKDIKENLKNHIEKVYESSITEVDDDILFDLFYKSIKYQVFCVFLGSMIVIHLYTGVEPEKNNAELLKLINHFNDRSPVGAISTRDEDIIIKTHIFNFGSTEQDFENFDASIEMLMASVDRYIPPITAVNSGFITAEDAITKMHKKDIKG